MNIVLASREVDQPQPWAPVLSLDEVNAAEALLDTTLPDDFWSAVAAQLDTFADAGIAMTPAGVVANATWAGSELIVLIDRRGREPEDGHVRGDFVCVRRGATWPERNAQPFVLAAGDAGRALYPSFVDLLAALLGDDPPTSEDAPGAVYFAPELGTVAAPEPAPITPPARVRHARFGLGTVLHETFDAGEKKLAVAFDDGAQRVVLARAVEALRG